MNFIAIMSVILSDIDSQRYGELLSKQFISIAREELISNEEAWQLFLSQPDAVKINKNTLPMLKNILYGTQTLESDVIIRAIKENNHCPLIPVIFTMSKGNLSDELIKSSNTILAKVLAF